MKWVVEERGPAIRGFCWLQHGTVEASNWREAREQVAAAQLQSRWAGKLLSFRVRRFPARWQGVANLDCSIKA
jgi:hypothetical protein